MRYFVTMFAFTLFGLQNLFAQNEDEYSFDFAYKVGKEVYAFKLSALEIGLKNLPQVVKKTYNKQKSAGVTAYFAKTMYKSAGKSEIYYCIYEFLPDNEEKNQIIYLYDAQGKWLYTLSSILKSDKAFWDNTESIIRKYLPEEEENDLSDIPAYKIQSSKKGVPPYLIELNLKTLKSIYTQDKEMKNSEEFGMRLLLDANKQVSSEYKLFGSGSAVSELNFCAPIFWR